MDTLSRTMVLERTQKTGLRDLRQTLQDLLKPWPHTQVKERLYDVRYQRDHHSDRCEQEDTPSRILHLRHDRKPNSEHPVYPDQSFASLSRPHPLRTRSSHPAQNNLYNDIKPVKSPLGAITADNTPMSSPGLFSLRASPSAETEEQRLHHLQKPKETHIAEVEHDVYSGNKFINNYEVVDELGRGEHGKVKLARNVENGHHFAVKIVPRYSRQRRLGRLGAPEDRTKREVAILKKARHPNRRQSVGSH